MAASPRPDGIHVAQREYRIVIAAQGCLEDAVITESMQCLFESELWTAMPMAARTGSSRGLAFRMVSRVLCLAHTEKVYNSRYQLKTFLLLVDPSLYAEVLAETCQWDQWTTSFSNTYLGQGIDSPFSVGGFAIYRVDVEA